MQQLSLSRPIVAKPETASQTRLQSRLGLRTPLYAAGMQGTAQPWIRQRTHAHSEPSDPSPVFVWFCGFGGATSGNSYQLLPASRIDSYTMLGSTYGPKINTSAVGFTHEPTGVEGCTSSLLESLLFG